MPRTRNEQARDIARDMLSVRRDAVPADLTHLDADQALDWIAAGSDSAQGVLIDAIGEATPGVASAINRLTIAVLGDVTLDQILELRDVLRTALIDAAAADVRAHLMRYGTISAIRDATARPFTRDQYVRQHGVAVAGDPLGSAA